MAKVEYAFPVETIHGKVAKRHKIGFAHRKASKLNYTQSYSKRSTKYSQAEKDHQAKFAAVAAMVNARLADPNQMPLDQLAFKGQSKYKTLRQYVLHMCSEEYDKQNAECKAMRREAMRREAVISGFAAYYPPLTFSL